MTSEQQRRLLTLSFLGSFFGGFLAFIASKILNTNTPHVHSSENIKLGFLGFLGTLISIQVMWRIMLNRKAETKKRGAKYGALAGLLSVVIMITLSSYWYSFENPTKLDNIFMGLVVVPIVMSFFAFMFGGFIAPILGSIIGHYFSRDLE